jgi:hypothetical protein
VVQRTAESTLPHVAALDQTAATTLLIDLPSKAVTPVADGLTPVAWLDDHRLLGYTGRDQAKRLAIVTL